MIKRLKKIGCCTLVAFTLVFNVSFDAYRGTLQVKGAELALAAMCDALVETFMLSLGMSYSSTTDLTTGGAALSELVNSAAEYIEDGFTSYNELSTEVRAQTTLWAFELALQLQEVDSYGDSVALTGAAYSGIQDWCRDMVREQAVEDVYTSSVAGNKFVKLVDDITPSIFLQFMKDLYPTLDISNAESVAAAELIGSYPFVAVSESYSSQNVLQTAYIYFCPAECLYYTDKGIKYGNSNYSNLTFYYSLTYPAFDNTYGAVPYIKSSEYNSYFNVSDCYILMEKSVPIYSSYADYIARINSSVYAPASTVYGSSDLAKEISEDETISIPIVEPYVTAQVEDIIDEAVTTYPAITEEEINDLVIEKIKAITIAEEDTTTGEKTDEVTKEEDINLLYDLTGIFPFCIPFDLYEAIKSLKSTEKAPVFKIPIAFPYVGVTYVFEWDLTEYDDIIDIIKAFEVLGFCVGLMYATGKLMKW